MLLMLFKGLSVAPSWAAGSCGCSAAAPGCTNRQGEKRNCLKCCESSLYYGTLWRSVLGAAASVCSVRRWEQGREKKAERSCVCVSVCLALPSCSTLLLATSAAMQSHRYVCWAGAGRASTALGAGGHAWRPTVTVNVIQSSPAASQALPISSGDHCLPLINLLYFPVGYSWGKERRYNRTPWAALLHKCP